MQRSLEPLPCEVETLVRYWAMQRCALLHERSSSNAAADRIETPIQAATERLAQLAHLISDDDLAEVVTEVETYYRGILPSPDDSHVLSASGDDCTPRHQAATPIEIHNVIGTPQSGHWLHTHGMDRLGLPELEIRGVPSYFVDPAGEVLQQISKYMQEPGRAIRIGETIQIGPHSVAKFEISEPIKGSENHYEVERWSLAAVGSSGCVCGTSECADLSQA